MDCIWTRIGGRNPTLRLDQTEYEFKIRRGIVGEGASPNEPNGRHNAHHAFDVITLSDSAIPITAYAIIPVRARALLGVYPVGS